MTTLHDKIAALPEWPERIASDVQPWQTIVHEHRAALARLALAREWIESEPHTAKCPWRGLAKNAEGFKPVCTCGRDALLKALEAKP